MYTSNFFTWLHFLSRNTPLTSPSNNKHEFPQPQSLEISKRPHVHRHLPHHVVSSWAFFCGSFCSLSQPTAALPPFGVTIYGALLVSWRRRRSARWDTWDQDGLHAIPLPISRTSSVAMQHSQWRSGTQTMGRWWKVSPCMTVWLLTTGFKQKSVRKIPFLQKNTKAMLF